MKKTIIIGDIHGRDIWQKILEKEPTERVIFVGDYFDSFDIPTIEQIDNFKRIIEYKESKTSEVILLVGNHDAHYMNGTNERYSGYQYKMDILIIQVLEENKHHLQMSYKMGNYLFTHAGVSSAFMDSVYDYWNLDNMSDLLNDTFKYRPHIFNFGLFVSDNYINPYGDDNEQSPIWIRPRSLMSANKKTLSEQIIQVVGHTQVEKIDTKGMSDDNRYWFIDCLGTSGQYMVIDKKGDVHIKSVEFN